MLFHVPSAMTIIVVHIDNLHHHIGMGIGYFLVYYMSFYRIYQERYHQLCRP